MVKQKNYFLFLSEKKGVVDLEKIIMGVIIIMIFIGLMGAVFMSDLYERFSEGFPVWFFPLLLVGLGLGVIYLIRK